MLREDKLQSSWKDLTVVEWITPNWYISVRTSVKGSLQKEVRENSLRSRSYLASRTGDFPRTFPVQWDWFSTVLNLLIHFTSKKDSSEENEKWNCPARKLYECRQSWGVPSGCSICLDESLREALMEPDVTDGEGLSFREATTWNASLSHSRELKKQTRNWSQIS